MSWFSVSSIVPFSNALSLTAFSALVACGTLVSYRLYLRMRAGRSKATLSPDVSTAILSVEPLRVVIPVFNEAGFITRKLENLFSQDYPLEKLDVVVVDGGSTDSTLDEVKALAARYPQVTLLRSPVPGKIPQLNTALRSVSLQQLVVVTDADALFQSRDVLRRVAEAFSGINPPGLVGGSTQPGDSRILYSSEYSYWDGENQLRFLETRAGSASIAVAPLYAFRRGLLDEYPEDCVADDIFISWRAHLAGQAILYSEQMPVVEVRQPGTFKQLLFHKFRKGNAYSRELLRVVPQAHTLSGLPRVLFLYRMMCFFAFPVLGLLMALGGIALLFHGAGALNELYPNLALLVGIIIILGVWFGRHTPPVRWLLGRLMMNGVLTVVLLANLFALPFWRQSSSYGKVSPASA